jgi:phosphoribosylformylglycinamidine synthase
LIHSYVPKNAAKENWDLLIVGKPTDNSGFGGASFASGSFEADDDIESKKAAVQQPNPFLERHIIASFLDLWKILKAEGKYDQIAIKDLGAGGVVCATVEICESAGFGADVQLDDLHVAGKYPPHVIACSETQERFCIACHPSLTKFVVDHFMVKWDLPKVAGNAGASVVGKVLSDDQFRLKFGDEVLCDAPASLITNGILYARAHEARPESTDITKVSLKGTNLIFA